MNYKFQLNFIAPLGNFTVTILTHLKITKHNVICNNTVRI